MDSDVVKGNFSTGSQVIYQGYISIYKDTYDVFGEGEGDVSIILNERIIDLTYAGDIANAQFTKYKGDQWNLSVVLKDTSRFFTALEGADVSLVFSDPSYTFDLTYVSDGVYTALMNWSSIRGVFEIAKSYTAELIVEKETFTTLTREISLILYARSADLVYEGDFDGRTRIEKVSGNTFQFSVGLYDNLTESPILNASVRILFDDPNVAPVTLSDLDGDGIYTAEKVFTKEEARAFIRDQTLTATLQINKEDYDIDDERITIVIGMQEIADGVPIFYALLGVAGIVLIAGTLGGYRYVQYARIPDYVKKINATKKQIAGNKTISDENIAPRREEEMVEQFSEYWEILDLDLAHILKVDEINTEQTPMTTGDEVGGGL